MGALGTLEKEAKGIAAVYAGPLEQLVDAQALAARERVVQGEDVVECAAWRRLLKNAEKIKLA